MGCAAGWRIKSMTHSANLGRQCRERSQVHCKYKMPCAAKTMSSVTALYACEHADSHDGCLHSSGVERCTISWVRVRRLMSRTGAARLSTPSHSAVIVPGTMPGFPSQTLLRNPKSSPHAVNMLNPLRVQGAAPSRGPCGSQARIPLS